MEDRFGKLNDGGYNNLLVVVLVVVVIYLFISGFTKSKQQAYLDNAGLDTTTQQAQALRDAMNQSGINLLMDIDGTDVSLVMATAGQIKDYKAVSDAYRVLYNSELTTDLQRELSRTDLQQFWNIVYKTNGSSTTGGGSTSNVGKTVTANQTANIRIDKAPYGVEPDFLGRNKQATKGQVLGKYVLEQVLKNVPNTGNQNVFIKYSDTTFALTSFHWVLKSAVNLS